VRYDNKKDAEKGHDWKDRCPVICAQILFYDFEIFGAQEVKVKMLGDMLASLPGYDYVGVGRDDGKEKGEYAPIFYKKERFDLLKSGTFWLSKTTDHPNVGWDAAYPRICTWGEFLDRTSNKKIWFFNLHMDHKGMTARRESAKLVLKKVKEMAGSDYAILTGDFNVDQHNESYPLIANSDIFNDSYDMAKIRFALNGTINHFNTDRYTDSRIDHVFVSKNFKVNRYGVLTDTYRTPTEKSKNEIKSDSFPSEVSTYEYIARTPSDHFPVKVELEY